MFFPKKTTFWKAFLEEKKSILITVTSNAILVIYKLNRSSIYAVQSSSLLERSARSKRRRSKSAVQISKRGAFRRSLWFFNEQLKLNETANWSVWALMATTTAVSSLSFKAPGKKGDGSNPFELDYLSSSKFFFTVKLKKYLNSN